MKPSIEIVEVGPRDGLQNERRTLSIDQRVDLIHRLLEAGARRLEAVSFVRPDLVPQMAGAEEVLDQLPRRPDVTYIGLVLNRRGAERAASSQCTEINIAIPVTDAFSLRNQGTSVLETVDQSATAVTVARDAGMSVSVTLAVAFGCPFSGRVTAEQVRKVYEPVADLGVDEVAFADTIGVGAPSQVTDLAALVVGDDRVPHLRFHFHNTRNTGYVNAHTAANLAGIGQIALDASVGGFGGCPFAPAATGNIATEDLSYLLREDGSPHTRLDLAALNRTAAWLADQLGNPAPSLLTRAGDFPTPLEETA